MPIQDEMGMGKTLQTIVTILDNRPKLQHSSPGAKHPAADQEARLAEEALWNKTLEAWKHEMVQNNVPKSLLPRKTKKQAEGGARAGTLVICPVIALSQWKSEIEKFSEEGALTVTIYHGPNRAAECPREMLRKYDVVLTTYQVLEADFRKMTSPNKVKCPNCGGKFKIDKLRVHLKYFCGEGAQRTEAQSRQRRGGGQDNGNGQRGPQGGGGGRGGNGKGKGGKAEGKKSFKKPAAKKTKRVKGDSDFDSESELSEAEQVVTTGRRKSRSAAMSASKKMTKSKKDWSGNDKDDDSYEDNSYQSESTDEDLEDDVPKTPLKRKRGGAKTKNIVKKKAAASSDESSDIDSDVMAASRKKQAEALREAKKGKKGAANKKGGKKVTSTGSGKATSKKKGTGNGKAKKGKKDSSDSDESDNDNKRDPFEDIDLDGLMQEAMDGAQMAVLHSLSWWRIVLDEAHFVSLALLLSFCSQLFTHKDGNK